jgi:hypothetical protein
LFAVPRWGFAVLVVTAAVGCNPPRSQRDPTASAQVKDKRILAVERGQLRIYTEWIPPGKTELSFENAPPYVRALETAPAKRERELDKGDWLVLAALTGSVPDFQSILAAIDTLEERNPGLTLGVRLIDDYDETKTWYPEYDGVAETPIWLCYSGGKVVGKNAGVLSADQIAEFIRTSFPK